MSNSPLDTTVSGSGIGIICEDCIDCVRALRFGRQRDSRRGGGRRIGEKEEPKREKRKDTRLDRDGYDHFLFFSPHYSTPSLFLSLSFHCFFSATLYNRIDSIPYNLIQPVEPIVDAAFEREKDGLAGEVHGEKSRVPFPFDLKKES